MGTVTWVSEADEERAPGEVTQLLRSWSLGDDSSRDRALTLLYGELRRRAHGALRGRCWGDSLDATTLVHEGYLRLLAQVPSGWQNRSHFLAIAATMMRRIVIDHARRRAADKRGASWQRVTLELPACGTETSGVDVIALGEALDELERLDPGQARLVEARFFGGLSIEDTAEVLGVSPATVKREWRIARAWLWQRLGGQLTAVCASGA